MRLESPAFTEGSKIPAIYTCDGEDASPPLHWSDPPHGTHSFVLLCDDPDAPGGTWHHWAAYNIPVHTRALAKDASEFDPRKFFKASIVAAREVCKARFEAFGSAGRASAIRPIALDRIATQYAKAA